MGDTWTTLRENAARCPSVPCHLAPPLKESWGIRLDTAPKLPLVVDGTVVVRDRKSILKRYDTSTVAMNEEGHKKKWSVDCVGPLTVWNGRVITSSNYRRRPEKIEIRDALTGKVEQTIDAPIGMHHAVLRDTLLEHSFEKDHHLVRAVSLTKARVLWEYVAPDGVRIDAPFAAKDDRVVVAQDDGAVIAFSLGTGGELWRTNVAELSVVRPSDGQFFNGAASQISIHDDSVIILVTSTYIVSLSLDDGCRRWKWDDGLRMFATGYLYDGGYYLLGANTYCILDAAAGKVLLDVGLSVPANVGVGMIYKPMLVSETHLFTGTMQGSILAFERDTGKFAWAGKPKKGGPTDIWPREFATANGRLYYADTGFRLWCMEEVTPSDPGRQVKRKSGRK